MRKIVILALLSCILITGLLGGCMEFASVITHQSPVTNHTPTDISGPLKIKKPGYYRLVNDIKPSNERELVGNPPQASIQIVSSGVILDGMGHTIDGSQIPKMRTSSGQNPYVISYSAASTGISVGGTPAEPISDVIITNISVTNWYWGIHEYSVRNNKIQNIVVANNSEGIRLDSSYQTRIENSTITQNEYVGIYGMDVEDTNIGNNKISGNLNNGIVLNGKTQMLFARVLFGRQLIIPGIFFDQSHTSGNGQVIVHNQISEGKTSGISITNSNSNVVESNSIQNTRSGIRINGGGENDIIRNNSYSQNGQNAIVQNTEMDLSILLGVILIILLKIFIGIINVVMEVIFKPLRGVFVFKPVSDEANSNEGVKSIFNFQLPSFMRNNLFESFIGALIFGAAYAYAIYGRLNFLNIGTLTLIAGIIIVSHELIHFLIAQRLGLRAAFRIWSAGVVITLITAVLFRNVFGQPILTTIEKEDECDKKKLALVMLSGPLVNLVLSAFFYAIYLTKGPYSLLGFVGFEMSLLMALISFLPLSSLDGERVYKWSPITWGLIFILIYGVYGYFFVYPDILLLCITGGLGVLLFAIVDRNRNFRKNVKEKTQE